MNAWWPAACAALALCGCSSQQLYATGQQWQRNECRKQADDFARARCEQAAALPYERYASQAARGGRDTP